MSERGGRYRIEFAPAAVRQFRELAGPIRRRIQSKIDSLGDEPRPHGCEKLEGADDLYRVRVGDWRIIYQIGDRQLLVLIVKIGNRRDVYR